MKNFSSFKILSFPLIIILVDRMIFRQYLDQYPISFPPNKVIFCGNKSVGKKTIDIKIIPEKKENENKKFLIIFR